MFGTTIRAIPSRTCTGPMPMPMPAARELPANVDAAILDSHTIPIIFGTIGVLLAFIAIAINILFGVLQIRAINNRARDDVECGKGAVLPAAAATNEATTRATLATDTKSCARETFPINHQHTQSAPYHHLPGERESLSRSEREKDTSELATTIPPKEGV